MRSKMIFIVTIAALWFVNQAAAGDLMQQYLQNNSQYSKGQISYSLGPTIPAPSGQSTTVNLSAGIVPNGSCGALSLKAALPSISQTVQGLENQAFGILNGVITSAPMLAICYASQTLCDIYKYYRANANAALTFKQSQCQAIEKLAADAGSSLRNQRIMQCIQEHGGDYTAALDDCGTPTDLHDPVTGQLTAGYKLSDVVGNVAPDNPAVNQYVTQLLGDIQFNASAGMSTLNAQRLGQEYMLGDLTKKYYNALKSYDGTVPPAGDPFYQTVSTPGFPLNPMIMNKIVLLDPATRDNFYQGYATVASMTEMTYRIEDATNALETAKNSQKDKDSIAKTEQFITQLHREYDMLEKKMALQRDYLVPMFTALMATQVPGRPGIVTPVDVQNSRPPLPTLNSPWSK
ncbi:MAG: hypothetical protein ACHQ0Y_14545 [Thermodesulfovibrionales bacterium]